MCGALWSTADAPPRCTPPPSPARNDVVAFEPMFGGATFEKPVQAVQHPTRSSTWLVALHRGRLQQVEGGRITTVLDIRDRVVVGSEWGLQDVTLHPRFPADRRLFAAYVTGDKVSRVSAFELRDDLESFDPRSETVLLSERHDLWEHAVSGLRFGPDGFLYIGWGEGGLKDAEPGLRGKILRIDVDHREGDRPYALPANPFIDRGLRPEAYAIGFRVPWRMSFDEDGTLWVGDVGEHRYEEVNRVQAGGDYGWPSWEGMSCRETQRCSTRRNDLPVVQQTHGVVCAIVGGYVYRGGAITELTGKYLYADSCSGTIWAVDLDAEPPTSEAVAHNRTGLASFAQDAEGEIYVVETRDRDGPLYTTDTGQMQERPTNTGKEFRILKLVRSGAGHEGNEHAGAEPSSTAVSRLSQTGCISHDGFRSAPAGLMAYSLNQPAWHDGAQTYYFAQLPPMSRVWGKEIDPLAPAPGSLLMKTIAFGDRPVETQMLARRSDGSWDAFDFAWNEEGNDAVLVQKPTTVRLEGEQPWHFPGPEGCAPCHNPTVGMMRGLAVSQLNREAHGHDQILALERKGTIEWPWKGGALQRLPAPDDEAYSLEQRARAYLHVNCAHCHQPGGHGARSALDLRRNLPLPLAHLCGTRPLASWPGHEDALLVSPGDPQNSLLSLRMRAAGTDTMPPQRGRVDELGAKLVDAWIASLETCPPDALHDH